MLRTAALVGINTYDKFGIASAANIGSFGYTGQAWLPGANVWYYKARVYEPVLGRFLQTDPIGYEDSPNLYAYVLNDPVNFVDPLGSDVVVIGKLPRKPMGDGNLTNDLSRLGMIYSPGRTDVLGEGGGDRECSGQEGSSSGCVVTVTAQLAPRLGPPPILLVRPTPVFRPTVEFPGIRNVRPGPNFIWKGPPGSGQWYNPKTGESLRPDFKNPAHRPHWDYQQRGKPGRWRWYGPGKFELKGGLGQIEA